VVPAGTPILSADDLGALRGDGIFETMHVRAGTAWLLDEHLDRMRRSAARMGLDLPHPDRLVELVATALAAWPAGTGGAPGPEGALRLVCTRGSEAAAGPPTVFATLNPVPPAVVAARHAGLAVLSASLGIPAQVRDDAPWLLGGAKTLSYAVNMASQRWALEQGADDVLWVSGDGYALEAPTSTLVWLDGTTLWTVPTEGTGILAGTTARWLLDRAGDLGFTADARMVRPAELYEADGVWLTSSIRGPAALRTLDGRALAANPDVSARIRALLGFD
jgi:4-amino-4-deoxychorismate lyase